MKWTKAETQFVLKSGDHLRVTAEDFGAVGMKFVIKAGREELGVIVEPKEIDQFRKWLAETTSTDISFLPPKAESTIEKILQKDEISGFLGAKERAILEQCKEGLEKAKKIREEDNLAATKGRLRQM